jgi:RIO-like serine/threonine protein kinase
VLGPDGAVYVGGTNSLLARVTTTTQSAFNLGTINGSVKPFNFVVAARGYVYTIDTFNSYVYKLHK